MRKARRSGILTGPRGPGCPAWRFALVAGECDLATGIVRLVIARGRASILLFDVPRGCRLLTRSLGGGQARWYQWFLRYLDPADKNTVWIRLPGLPRRHRSQLADLTALPSPSRRPRTH